MPMAMKQVTLHIPDSNYAFFMELIKNLSFVKKVEESKAENAPSKKEVMDSIVEGIQKAKLHSEGKIQLQTAQQLLDEL
jgi:hypothetical protein